MDDSLGPFALGAGSRDAVVANVFAAAGYTAQVSGVGGTTGDAIMELYDGAPANSGVRLVNLSTRTQLDDGERLIVGFTLAGSTSKSLILRAVGPTLAAFGLPAAHPDPRVELYSADGQIAGTPNGCDSGRNVRVAAADRRPSACARFELFIINGPRHLDVERAKLSDRPACTRAPCRGASRRRFKSEGMKPMERSPASRWSG